MDPNTLTGGISAAAGVGSLAFQIRDARGAKHVGDALDHVNLQQDSTASADTAPDDAVQSTVDHE